jgi:hypothetical protein
MLAVKIIFGIVIIAIIYYGRKFNLQNKKEEEKILLSEKHAREVLLPWGLNQFFGPFINRLFIVEENHCDRIGIRYIGKNPNEFDFGKYGKEAKTIIFDGSLYDRGGLYFIFKDQLPIEIQELNSIISFVGKINGIYSIKKYHLDERFLNALYFIGTYETILNPNRFIEIKTTKRVPDKIIVDTSDEACLALGFQHKNIIAKDDRPRAEVMGVAPGNDGRNVLWYIIEHPSIKGLSCYWGGQQRNLKDAGFIKLN